MSIYKNTAGQTLRVFAFVQATGDPVLNDAANITCDWAIDGGAPAPLTDTNPVEVQGGYYLFDLTQAETNGDELDPYPVSSTPGVRVIVTGFVRATRPIGGSSGGGGSGSVYSPYTSLARWPVGPGPITGSNILVDRLPFGASPKVWPVSSLTLKDHVQIDHSEDDALLDEYLAAATEDAENRGNVALIRQSRIQTIGWDLIFSGLSNTHICLSVNPVLSVTAVKYIDPEGNEASLSVTNYRLLPDRESLYFFGELPALIDGPGSMWIEYEAGYGDTPATVPSAWRSIVSQLAFRKYDYRGGDTGPSNDSFERMLDRMIVAAGGSRRG